MLDMDLRLVLLAYDNTRPSSETPSTSAFPARCLPSKPANDDGISTEDKDLWALWPESITDTAPPSLEYPVNSEHKTFTQATGAHRNECLIVPELAVYDKDTGEIGRTPGEFRVVSAYRQQLTSPQTSSRIPPERQSSPHE